MVFGNLYDVKKVIYTLNKERENVIISLSRTMHTYNQIIMQMAEVLKIEIGLNKVEKELIRYAFSIDNANKKLFVIIDEAHLFKPDVLRKLRLFLEQFPKRYILVLFGQTGLMHTLALKHNVDIKNRITFSAHIKPLNDAGIEQYIMSELEKSKLGAHVFDEAAIEVIVRAVDGNLRLCRNLAYYSLVEACRDQQKQVNIHHVNQILMMPHWRSHEEILKHSAKDTIKK